jgi:hypothetical protein
MESTLASCSGTGCKAIGIGMHQELKEVPTWRRPNDRPDNERVFEVVANVSYCEQHEKDAKAVPTSILPR